MNRHESTGHVSESEEKTWAQWLWTAVGMGGPVGGGRGGWRGECDSEEENGWCMAVGFMGVWLMGIDFLVLGVVWAVEN